MQEILTFITILGAVAYLLRGFYKRFLKKESKCESCAFGSNAQD